MIINLSQRKKVIANVKLLAIPLIVLLSFGGLYVISRFQTPQQTNINTPTEIQVCIETKIPKTSRDQLSAAISQLNDSTGKYKVVEIYPGDETKDCTAVIRYNLADTDIYTKVWSKLYVPVVKYSTNLLKIDTDKPSDLIVSRNYNEFKVTWDTQANNFLAAKYDLGSGYTIAGSDNVLDDIQTTDNTIALISFDKLNSKLRVLPINNLSPLNKDFNLTTYPFVESYWLKSDNSQVKTKITTAIKSTLGTENYEEDKITDVIVTGPSRIGLGAQYDTMAKANDFTLPVSAISTTLHSADFTSISLENPIFDGCNTTNIGQYICSNTNALNTIKATGADIVGLTSEHMLDFNAEKLLSTISTINSAGIKTYGAGSNLTQANAPVIVEKNGLKFAFVGSNFVPTWFGVWATANKAGTATYFLDELTARVKQIKAQADFVFIDMQWGSEYSSKVENYEKEYGHAVVDSGADFVTGVNSGEVGPVEYYQNGTIFYSLGNFISDRNGDDKSKYGVAVRHIFYGKRYIGYELLPVYNDTNFQLQMADDSASAQILDKLFK